jgi:hypothetical protein
VDSSGQSKTYAEEVLKSAAISVASRQLRTNDGDGRVAYVAHRDCAEAAAVVLSTSGHEGRTYNITGPELVSAGGIAHMLSGVAVAGRGGRGGHARHGVAAIATERGPNPGPVSGPCGEPGESGETGDLESWRTGGAATSRRRRVNEPLPALTARPDSDYSGVGSRGDFPDRCSDRSLLTCRAELNR